MRRRSLTLALAALALATVQPSGADTLPTAPFLPRACTPEGPLDVVRPASCVRTTYWYGPLHVTSGDNLIMLGPVSIERPAQDGNIVRFKADLKRADGSTPYIEEVHLHHAVWISSSYNDPIFATGEEKTVISIPNGYGIPFRAMGEMWLLNYMLHNQLASPDTVFITYDIDLIPSSAPGASSIKRVEPHWLDVGDYNRANPVYNTQRGFGSVAGRCAFPRENCARFDPYGKKVAGNGIVPSGDGKNDSVPTGTIVAMFGHLHPGGLRVEVDLKRSGAGVKRVFNSDAVYYDPGGPVSWDLSMEVTDPSYRLRIKPGDVLVTNSIYDTARASWYEGMGIVVTFVAPGDTSGPDAFTSVVDPDNTGVTHGHMTEADHHGGPDRPPGAAPIPLATDTVTIGGYTYLPGQQGSATAPAVRRGSPLHFYNTDAAAMIFHTVTACAFPCNGTTGISYPLANGPVDFDSLELGYGPPGFTAASNTARWDLDTKDLSAGTYTYFCRIHPFMRGSFVVQ